ncbi:MAG TPA: AAA family ATPase [Solirubrobacteraceae bacterium]|nr:AAA family ATPase [Solirubrobacteraceae bacterium]
MLQAVAARPDAPRDGVSAPPEDHPRGRLRGRSRERERLEWLLSGVRSGRSGVLVLRGEAGIGKTALLEQFVEAASGCVVTRATGVQADMELPFAGLQQLFGSMLGSLERLPHPQREAVEVAFGLRSGPAPDRFDVGLAMLGLLAEVAEQEPIVCVVDDAQWLDQASARTLAFVARRLMAESVALVFAVRDSADEQTFAGLPELVIAGLNDEDARGVLGLAIAGRVDARVIERIVAETRGNPLALLELPRGLSAAELAGGFGVSSTHPLSARLEQSFIGRVGSMPDQTQRFLLLAAAEPVGDPALLIRAAELVGLGVDAAAPAEAVGLIELADQVRFPHPLVRSAIYRAAPLADRQRVHRALADATDEQTDPDRRTWHRAQAALGTDDDLAVELERSAQRAQARGGLAAAAAFLERAAALTLDRTERAHRALAAAQAKYLSGSPEAALTLLDSAATAPMGPLEVAMAQRLRGRIALHVSRSAEAAPLLLDAAGRLEALDPRLARDTHLEALYAASIAGRLGGGMVEAAIAAQLAPPGPPPARAVDLLLDGLGVRYTDGSGAAAPILKRALSAMLDDEGDYEEDMRWPWLAARVAADLFDDETWQLLASRHLQIARDAGALGALQIALIHVSQLRVFEGKLDAAAALIEETDSIIDATGSRRINVPKLMLAACRGDERATTALIEDAERDAITRGQGLVLTFGEHARAVLHNALGHYDVALDNARHASAQDELHVSVWSLPELVEAAARSGEPELAADALERLRERTQAAGTEWALGVHARSRALLSDGQVAEALYREAIDRLGRCRVALDLARARLLYGEWLRRRGRRVDARQQLRSALASFAEMGAGAFAARAERELLATGETSRKRTIETTDDLTPHEARIARMARDGASNQDIATELFVSRKTVEYHLHKVFTKLGISTRQQLEYVLPGT